MMEEEDNVSFSFMRTGGDFMASNQQQQGNEPRFGDDGLWRRLLSRAQQGTSNHNFFLVNVVEGCLHTNLFCKLGLPTAFMHHHYKSLSEHVILEGPDGKRWPTMLGLQLDSQPCLMHGWKEFAASYNLELKDQVVFLLLESSHFLVQVYDSKDRVKSRRRLIPPPSPQNQNVKYGRSLEEPSRAVNQSQKIGCSARSAVNQAQNVSFARKEEPRAAVNQAQKMGCNARSEEPRAVNQAQKMGCNARSEEPRAVNQAQKMGEDLNAVNQVNTPARQSISLSVHGCNAKATKAKTQTTYGETLSVSRRYIQISDNSEEEEDGDDEDQARPSSISLNPVPGSQKQDASESTGKESPLPGSKMTLRSAAKAAAAEVVTPAKDADRPSSPESMVVLKRSRRLQRKSGDYEGDDLGRATTNILRRKLYKLSSAVSPPTEKEPAAPSPKEIEPVTPPKETEPAAPPPKAKEPAAPRELAARPKEREPAAPREPAASPKEREYSCCSTQHSSMKRHRELQQQRSTSANIISEDEKRRPVMIEEASKRAHNLFYISKRRPVTAQERHRTLQAAQAYAQSLPTSKHYVLPLSVAIYCGYHLRVRPEFVEALQLPLSKMWLKLRDSSGKMWEVEWKGNHPRQHVGSQGWTKFVVEHYLEEGDVCVFQKCAPNSSKIILSVEIFRIVPLLEPPEDGWRSHYIVPDRQLLPTQSQC